MGSILINVPDISDSDLVFDEDESKRILKFFWPHLTREIDGMTIDNDARRLAQTALVAAIEGSYATGFIQALAQTVVRPGSGIKALAKKLGRRFIKHWWKHTNQQDLEDVKIYEFIRNEIARQLKHRIGLMQQGAALRRGNIVFYAVTGTRGAIWA